MTHQNKEGLEALLPCPMCGGAVHMTELDDEDDRRVWVRFIECEICDLKVRRYTGWPPKGTPFNREALSLAVGRDLITAWNRRAQDATSQAHLKIYREALEPFADFGELLELETEGFSDTDRLELVQEESDVRIGDLFVAAFRRARTALSQEAGK